MYDGNEGCYDYDKCRHTYAVRDEFSQKRNHQVGHCKDNCSCQPHSNTINSRCCNSQCRTHTQHQHESRIFFNNTVYKTFSRCVCFHDSAPPSTYRNAQSPALTPFVMAFVVMVAPLMASIWSSDVEPVFVYVNFSTFLFLN